MDIKISLTFIVLTWSKKPCTHKLSAGIGTTKHYNGSMMPYKWHLFITKCKNDERKKNTFKKVQKTSTLISTSQRMLLMWTMLRSVQKGPTSSYGSPAQRRETHSHNALTQTQIWTVRVLWLRTELYSSLTSPRWVHEPVSQSCLQIQVSQWG